MRRGAAWALCAVLALGGAAWLARAQSDSAVDLGHRLFQRNCELCHGRNGRGDGPLAEDLKVHPADLTGIAARRGGSFPDAEIAEVIDGTRHLRGHGNEMPIWGRAFAEATPDPSERPASKKEKVDGLIAYLRSIQTPPLGGGR